jgi:glycosyltransferase involved in cell wall biosynthesis
MKRDGKTLLLIDSATSGCAGGYIDGIVRNLAATDRVEVAVSHYFPFNYGLKIFYKYSELTAQGKYKLGWLRLYVRLMELLIALGRLLVYIRAARIRVVCYALSSNLWVEYVFLYLAKRVGRARVYLICHDVIPFVLPGEDYDQKLDKRRNFYQVADKLLVHNENSVRELTTVFEVPVAKIARFPFPLYDLSTMGLRTIDVLGPSPNKRFLFIGHLRAEKGIDVLLNAWSSFVARRPDAELIVAGNIPPGFVYDFAGMAEQQLRVIDRYLSDEEYLNLIRQADCVVLPYLRGTNSAVVSTALSQRKDLIVSDIEMFRNNPLIPAESFFRSGDPASLTERLIYFSDGARDDTPAAREARFHRYEAQFRVEVNDVFALSL